MLGYGRWFSVTWTDGGGDETSRFALDVTDEFGHDYGLVAVEAEDEEDARQTFEAEYRAYEVHVRTLPHDGETTEVVFARSEHAAEQIAVARRGEYSDVPRESERFDPDLTVVDVREVTNPDGRAEERAASELRREQHYLDSDTERPTTDGGEDQYRVRIWKGRNPDGEDYQGEPDEVVTVTEETTNVWQDDPRFDSGPIGLDVHPEDCPATLRVYTSDSVRSPPGIDSHVDEGYWDGPMEQGLPWPADHDSPPFGCEVWGRVLFFVEAGETR